jgi:peroxiredoxin/uncharacterized membrane protein YphA (DoxX/SURF4 family)
MAAGVLAARLLLAAVFLVAGVAKLVDRAGARKAAADFGLPDRLATPVAFVLPLAELAVAAALIPTATAWWGAVGALLLLLLFAAGIAANLARGRKPDCHCFGQLHSAPAGRPTLARNVALAGVAGLVVWQGPDEAGPSAVAWLGDLTTGELIGLVAAALLAMAVAGLAGLVLNLMHQNGRLLLRIEALETSVGGAREAGAEAAVQEPGLPVGTPAPPFSLPGLHGEILTLDFLRAAEKPVLLLFSDPGCAPCDALLPEVGRWQREHQETLTTALISRGDPEANRAKAGEHGVKNVLVEEAREVSAAYGEVGTPSAVVIHPDGTIGSPLAGGADAIRALVSRTVGTATVLSAPLAPAVGGPAPPIALRDLSGQVADLIEMRGRRALVLFWDPRCGFCQGMLDDLKAWEANRPDAAPEPLVVSTGSEEENRAMGLRSRVLLDEGFRTGGAYGVRGTPSAVLVDEDGRIASEVAAGAAAVLSLVNASSGLRVERRG